ncbi:LysR family transcriptional regulator [Sulfurirhabdus autotrophica]|uniref:DNA-binding transcriptional LysR family regulator n=1 Tax=Sulfurirhabdus autotrophica TaxID=1706046 RepID=A0A4V6P409_9PROT|nr:LysR family transcriptional regulator [Sulfurirhabdus autotrophica]TCV90579.1 DNA-binding transcriptional LysR family regulator [Sulfurirhabdus autotrophica]
MDRLHLINVFVAVVETNGFAGAARKLNISPPAVTRAINTLESQLGVRLLTRTTRVVRVTDAGARYAQDCRRIIAELADADESVSGMHSAPRGRLTLTAPVLFGAKYVTPIVTEYLQRHPEVSAACLFLDRVVNMLDEGMEVAIRIGELPDSSMQTIRVGQVRRMICAAPSYLEQHGIPQNPDDLTAHSIISVSGITPTPEWRLMVNGVSRSIKLQPRIATTTNDSAVTAAVSGFGLTQLLSYQVAPQLREGTLQTVLSEFEPSPLPVHVLHHEGRHASQRVRAFLDLAIERLRADSALN